MEATTPFANEELLINFTPQETRLALVENGVLQEVHIERATQRGLVGNIYCGKVSRVLPGMQAAFVDIGLEKAAFLHASDFAADSGETAVPNITECVRQDQTIIVQVIKDPLGTKGARLTTEITLPSRYLVLMPDTKHVGISQRIENEEERSRLRMLVEPLAEQMDAGFIVRTAAEGVAPEALQADARYLKRLWKKVSERKLYAKAGDLLYSELDLAARSIRDLLHDGVRKILVDSKENHARLQEFMNHLIPEEAHKLEYYPGERPLFDLYNIEDEIQNALKRKVELKSGGHIVIDQTEAMTTVDVNTGAYVGHSNLEETIFRTNLEAAAALARQLRLRNLGGIIIVDFIDMTDESHKAQVLRTLEKALEKDHAKTHISEVSSLGLVQMTRKRTRESLEHVLCEPCPVCCGRGTIKSAQTVCYELFREILRAARAYESQQIMVLASQSVIDRLLDEESDNVAELEAFIERPVRFQVETMYHQEQYDVIPV